MLLSCGSTVDRRLVGARRVFVPRVAVWSCAHRARAERERAAVMAHVTFDVQRDFHASSRGLWEALIDWKGHESWIPATRVELGQGDPTQPGFVITAWTGPRPVALKDVMRVEECTWDHELQQGKCIVSKLGPVLSGRAGFTVSGDDSHSTMQWFEDVSVKWLPRVLAPLVTWMSSKGFSYGMRRLERQLSPMM